MLYVTHNFHNSDKFRSMLIIFRDLLNFSKAYIKDGWVIKYINPYPANVENMMSS